MGPGDLFAQVVHAVVAVAKPVAEASTAYLEEFDRTVQRAVQPSEERLPAEVVLDAEPYEPPEAPTTPRELLTSLISRSMYDTPEQSRNALYVSLLKQLVPDEARILAALSDGSAYPLLHVAEPGTGNTALVLRNASTVGRAAGVTQPHHTPLYLTRLLNHSLVQLGPEVPEARDDYEMLLTDPAVHAAITTTSRSLRPARIIRRTVVLSALGAELWEAAQS